MKINSFSPVLLYYKAEIEQGRNKGHCNPKDGLGLKHVSVLWV